MPKPLTIDRAAPESPEYGLSVEVVLRITFDVTRPELNESEATELLGNIRDALIRQIDRAGLAPDSCKMTTDRIVISLSDPFPELTRVRDMADAEGIDLNDEQMREIAEEIQEDGASSAELVRLIREKRS